MSVSAYDRVRAAREKNRPTGLDYIHNLFGTFVGGIAAFQGQPVTVIAIEKGHSTKEHLYRNFGAPNPEGYRKAQRLMKQAEKFHRPVICFVDTSGAFCGIGAEERGQGQAIAESMSTMMTLQTPILAIVLGEGGSGGALAMAVANEVWMLENAIYSVISPEGCASILWKDSGKADQAAECLKLTADSALEFGLIEQVISEFGGNHEQTYAMLHQSIAAWLHQSKAPAQSLTQARYDRFRRIGTDFVQNGK